MTKPLTQADLDGPYVRESTGLQYKDFASWLAGDEPLDTARNHCVKYVTENVGKSFDDDTGASWPERSVEIYWRAYDGHEPITPDPRGDHGDPHMQRNVAAYEAIKREIAAAAVAA